MISTLGASVIFHATRFVAPWIAPAKRRLPAGGFVSFTFDDFPSSAAHDGASLIESFGARATFYASMSMTRRDDIVRIVERGHELGCHTYSHLDCFRASDLEVEADVARNAAALADALGSRANVLRHFAYPFGRLRPRQRRLLARRFVTQRSIFPGAHRREVDFRLIRANRLYSSPLLLRRARRLVEDVARHGGWVVFFTHDVSERPTRWGAQPKEIADVAVRALRAGLTIAPVGSIADLTLPMS
jgi:peptidoglycan/xylan/chitin deacetylase (PgdA/CDA1 family)